MSTNDTPLISFLKEVMRRRRRKPSQLAADIGISHATVSRWLSSKDIPSIHSCIRLSEYSGVPTEKILSMVGHLPRIAEKPSVEWPEFREYARHKYPAELDEDLITMIEDLIERRRARKYGKKTPSWESELWSYLNRGDGVHCPIYDSCRLRLKSTWCLSNNEDYYQAKIAILDNDNLNFANPADIDFDFHGCPRSGKIFRLVSRLAEKYQREAGIKRPPIPDNIITKAYDNLPIKVRQVPLKTVHGAVWRLSDCWLIHLNRNDTSARRRFTLYHEIFHGYTFQDNFY